MKRIILFAALIAANTLALAGDWSKPLTTSTYTNFVTEIKDRDSDLALGFDPAVTAPTNFLTNTIRWSSAGAKWQKWNGTAWVDLAASYAISITGSAPTLTTARTINGVSFNGSANISVNTVQAATFNNGGAGAASGTTFDGGTARTISYNTIGAPSTTGTGATGTWPISITGAAGSATSATTATTATTANALNAANVYTVSGLQSGSGAPTNGTVLLTDRAGGGENLSSIGTEYSSGAPIIGYAVKPSTSSPGAFLSTYAPALTRGAYTIQGNVHRWYGGASQAVAVGSPVTVTNTMSLDASGNLAAASFNGSGAGLTGTAGSLSIGGNAATASNALGYNQTWQDFTASRAVSTTYTNSTSKPIVVLIGIAGGGLTFTVNGLAFPIISSANGNTNTTGQVIVPPGQTYSATTGGSGFYWYELR